MQAQQYRSRRPQNTIITLVAVVGGLIGLGGLMAAVLGTYSST